MAIRGRTNTCPLSGFEPRMHQNDNSDPESVMRKTLDERKSGQGKLDEKKSSPEKSDETEWRSTEWMRKMLGREDEKGSRKGG